MMIYFLVASRRCPDVILKVRDRKSKGHLNHPSVLVLYLSLILLVWTCTLPGLYIDKKAVLPRQTAGTLPVEELAGLPGLRDRAGGPHTHRRAVRTVPHSLRAVRRVLATSMSQKNAQRKSCDWRFVFRSQFVHYLEGLKDPAQETKIKDVYERACTIHHLKKPNIHLQWATFEESISNFNRSAEILVNLERSVPNLLQVVRTLHVAESVLRINCLRL